MRAADARQPIRGLERKLAAMSTLIAHRGPDGNGTWRAPGDVCGLAHRRLAIIDLSPNGHQPMIAPNGTTITYNGEIYNYRELMRALEPEWRFRSQSDTETILAAHAKWGTECLSRLRGMFAFALWDGHRLFPARDPFGIKPLYYAVVDDGLYFGSEIKALLPGLPEIATDPDALAEYFTLQYTLGERTLFKHVNALLPGHGLVVENGHVRVFRYWDVKYELDFDHREEWFARELRGRIDESIALHLRSDVPVGAYISGGIDSSLVAILAAREDASGRLGFHGKFTEFPGYDESAYAVAAARDAEIALHEIDISAQ